MSRPPMPFGMMRPPGIAMGMPPGYPMPPGMMPQQQRGGRGPKDPMQDMMERQRFPWPNTFCKRFANMQEFEIMGPLGKGGFSEVFKGRCRRDGRIYAIKKVNLSVINVHDYEIIRDEVAIHSTLNNPGVVQFFDWMKEGDFIYIILEYVEGCTLFEYLNKHHPLPESFIKNIMKQILTALQYVHNQGVIHKDLKPENVLLDKQLNAKICDFGWAERKKAVNIR